MAAFEILKLKIFWGINLDQSVRIHNNESDCAGSTMSDKHISNFLNHHILHNKRNVDQPRKRRGGTKFHEDITSVG
jgi:hypothetical protein